MAADGGRINLLTVLERVVRLEGATTALHGRVDKVETFTAKSLEEIKSQQGEILKDLKDVIAWMNRGKGWAAATMLISGTLGAGLMHMLSRLFSTKS